MSPRTRARALAALACGALALAGATARGVQAPPSTLRPALAGAPEIRDRQGRVLTQRYGEGVASDMVPLHAIPPELVDAFVQAEDQRFFSHPGIDLLGYAHALWQNLRAGRQVRGASGISEQVARILHPRPRTLWSRWLEAVEALWLERRFGKGEILEFYLNRVPFGERRHGVRQAARGYFGRDLDTLSAHERLALAVLVRSPGRLDPARHPEAPRRAVAQLAARMAERGLLARADLDALARDPLALREPELEIEAPHFVRSARERAGEGGASSFVATTLDGELQRRAQALLDRRIRALAGQQVRDGAVLALDHQSGEVLVWASASRTEANAAVNAIDAVLTPRQPGSTLKPFAYALAMERGWNAATLIDDAPLDRPVGAGLHSYRNYSGLFYGPLRLREALGNSLNTPAVRAARFVGPDALLARLRQLGFEHLRESASHYGEGLVLGSGEVTLYELVRAYATLARGGRTLEPQLLLHERTPNGEAASAIDPDVAAIVADILSDPRAREREFESGLLHFPAQTAVKTGTSSGYHDAWAVGFSDRYTAGVWLGNLDRRPMREVSGAAGPAWVLRALFTELRRRGGSAPLPLPRHLVRVDVCAQTGLRARASCPRVTEVFRAQDAPRLECAAHAPPLEASAHQAEAKAPEPLALLTPTPGMHLAEDPRIPDALERFAFELPADVRAERIEWWLDGARIATGRAHRHLWRPTRGKHRVHARVFGDGEAQRTQEVVFSVR